jgi:DNA-binding transcriptional LysR family regulator
MVDAASWEARIGRRIRLRDLHMLMTVVQWGSMAKAARALNVSQPAVSKAIHDLEAALGVKLLDRGSQGIAPTLYGDVLVRRGAAVFDELRQGVGEIDFIANVKSGTVRVGCNESLSVALLPRIIQRLSAQHPGVTVEVAQMSRPITAEIVNLRGRNVDLIIGRGVFAVPEGDLETEVLFEEPLIVVAGITSPWARRRKIDLAELIHEKWIFYRPDEPPGEFVRQAFEARGLRIPAGPVLAMSFHLREMLLATGDYLTVVPACMLPVLNAKGRAVQQLPIELGAPMRPVAIFTLKHRTLSPLAERFIACARAAAQAVKASGRAGPAHSTTASPAAAPRGRRRPG